jgi:uncharacterized protein DUF3140
MSSGDDDQEVADEFGELVNMTASELKRWLATEQSQSVGVTSGGSKKSESGGGESVGHDSGRRIVTILERKKGDLRDGDYAHMRKVVGYIRRHRAQQPAKEDIADSRWRYSLMNWGHDPMKT